MIVFLPRWFAPWCLIFILALTLGGCAMFGETESGEPIGRANWTAEEYYLKARQSLNDRRYLDAVELYEALESRYPFGRYAEQALVDISYVHYKTDEHESALATIDRFLRLHPNHAHAPYMVYLKGLINFNRGIGFLDRFLPTDQAQRDPGAALQAQTDFEELILKYPNSIYAKDAKQRIIALRTNLALYELNVADYYMRRGAYLAAANRGVYVVENYQRTLAVPRALVLMNQAYTEMGMLELANAAQQVYDLNYPDGLPPLRPPGTGREPTLAEKVWDFFKLDE